MMRYYRQLGFEIERQVGDTYVMSISREHFISTVESIEAQRGKPITEALKWDSDFHWTFPTHRNFTKANGGHAATAENCRSLLETITGKPFFVEVGASSYLNYFNR